jgi:hypothetical protein
MMDVAILLLRGDSAQMCCREVVEARLSVVGRAWWGSSGLFVLVVMGRTRPTQRKLQGMLARRLALQGSTARQFPAPGLPERRRLVRRLSV